MANVEVLVGNAPTAGSSKDERRSAERFGYLVDRGGEVEWHRDGWAERWALPGHPSAGLPTLTAVRVSTGRVPSRRKLARPGRVRTPEFTVDAPAVGTGFPVLAPARRSWWRPLRYTGYGLLAVVVLVAAVLAFFLGDGGDWDFSGSPREARLWLLDENGGVMAVSGGCSTTLRTRFFPDSLLDRLRALGIAIT
jgi:hypothetical protein